MLLARSGAAYRQGGYGSIPIGGARAGVVGQVAGTGAGVLIGAGGPARSALPMFRREIAELRDPQKGAM